MTEKLLKAQIVELEKKIENLENTIQDLPRFSKPLKTDKTKTRAAVPIAIPT